LREPEARPGEERAGGRTAGGDEWEGGAGRRADAGA
jgi:hypothetical protein